MTPVRYLEPTELAALGPTLRAQLDTLRRPAGRFAELLRSPGEALAIVALDTTGVIGWASAEPDGLLGVYVHVRRRRQGIGLELATRARKALEARWPGVEWEASAKPGTVARAFWTSVRERWAAGERAA